MRNRWGILAVLFLVRGTTAFQFQNIASCILFAMLMLALPRSGAVILTVGPVVGGACAKWAGSAAAAFDFGAAAILACPVLLWGFKSSSGD